VSSLTEQGVDVKCIGIFFCEVTSTVGSGYNVIAVWVSVDVGTVEAVKEEGVAEVLGFRAGGEWAVVMIFGGVNVVGLHGMGFLFFFDVPGLGLGFFFLLAASLRALLIQKAKIGVIFEKCLVQVWTK
jgi:hypothetical protein